MICVNKARAELILWNRFIIFGCHAEHCSRIVQQHRQLQLITNTEQRTAFNVCTLNLILIKTKTVPPMLMIQNQLVGAPIGQNITLECISEAFPKSINYWMRSSRNDSIIVSGKYHWIHPILSPNDFVEGKGARQVASVRIKWGTPARAVERVLPMNRKVVNTKRAFGIACALQNVFMHETEELNLIFIAEKGAQYRIHAWHTHRKKVRLMVSRVGGCGRVCAVTLRSDKERYTRRHKKGNISG